MPRDFRRPDDPKPWSTIARRYIHSCPWVKLRQDHVRLANGAEIDDYYVLEYPDWVNAVLLTPSLDVVLIRIYRHGLGAIHYEVPGGCIDPGEAPEAAARREAIEETGYASEDWRSLGRVCANPGTHTNMTYLFLAEGVAIKAPTRRDETEEMSIVLTPLSEIPALLRDQGVIQASHSLALTRACQAHNIPCPP